MYATRITRHLMWALPLLALCLSAYADTPANRPAGGPPFAQWPCHSYTHPCGEIPTRPAVSAQMPSDLEGDPDRGRALAHNRSKGNCLTCHMMQGGAQGGTVAPDLSQYATWGRSTEEIYARIHDQRAFIAGTVMPPFGTNEILTEQEIMDIVSYLKNSR
ncbi:sulfur oxidation c-type cytochrome SoxX [Thioalkalivibrio denitrificans]|uniref:Sulfur oxidation c-type cytochrome SoxX n=1 Tax=Thioalkalivibrio denitrificans TaxID=108003 RepID=A0A1V3NEI8_9GAMM|nr:sulfur oxidation c-type cytochrome SoxX [Thioalkalivibrio denitrificans]OOG23414.1 sulfur oxidation c-type cytochrome SoxX [Thioalkalivibrio denitrificans]